MDDNAEEGARATIPPPIISSFFKQNDSFFYLKAEHFVVFFLESRTFSGNGIEGEKGCRFSWSGLRHAGYQFYTPDAGPLKEKEHSPRHCHNQICQIHHQIFGAHLCFQIQGFSFPTFP